MMVKGDGSAKGLRTILQEHGINVGTFKADDMRTVLANHEEFATEATQVEHYVNSRGFLCFFLPKFHCELNPIERVWGQSKRYCRAHTNFSLAKLQELLNLALDSVSVELMCKLFRKTRNTKKLIWRVRRLGRRSK